MGENCRGRDFIQGDEEDERERVEDSTQDVMFERRSREMAQGGRDRDSANKITGARVETPCGENLICNFTSGQCTMRPANSKSLVCFVLALSDNSFSLCRLV